LDALTRSSSARARNDAARGSLACALVGLAIPVVAYVAARQLKNVTIVEGTAATCTSALFGLLALLLARKAQLRIERTLGRVGGAGIARAGRILGLVSLCIGLTAGLALGFYSLLNYFG
jgi:hypothetical protein